MKEAVTKVIDTLTQEDFHGVFQKLLERYKKCIAVGGDYFEGDLSFMCVLSIKVPIRNKSGNLFNDPRMCACVCVHMCVGGLNNKYTFCRYNLIKFLSSFLISVLVSGSNRRMNLPKLSRVLSDTSYAIFGSFLRV